MNSQVRLATANDLKEVIDLYMEHYDEVWQQFRHLKQVRRFFDGDINTDLLVNVVDNKIVGAATIKYNKEGLAVGDCALTDRRYRRQGLSIDRRNFIIKRVVEKGVETLKISWSPQSRTINIKDRMARGWECKKQGECLIMTADPRQLTGE